MNVVGELLIVDRIENDLWSMTLSNYLLFFPCFCRWVLIFYNTGETLICFSILVMIELSERTIFVVLESLQCCGSQHDDIMAWKWFLHYWSFVKRILQWSLVVSLTKRYWCRDLTFSVLSVWIRCWTMGLLMIWDTTLLMCHHINDNQLASNILYYCLLQHHCGIFTMVCHIIHGHYSRLIVWRM